MKARHLGGRSARDAVMLVDNAVVNIRAVVV